MSETGMVFQPRAEHLSVDEIVRVATVARLLGVRSVRLTGGEPLLRRDLLAIVGRLAALGFDDLAMTTNGTRLAELAGPLATAGLDRVNVSCDSLRPERFGRIRRRGHLATVLAAMDRAEAAGLGPVKVNVVPMAGINDDEIEDFAAFGRSTGRTIRFIEFMPLDADRSWSRDLLVPADGIVERVHRLWPVAPVARDGDDAAPATRYRYLDGRGEIGVIASVTRPFCGTCDRLRLTADGAIRNCLFSADELSARDVVRGGGSDAELAALLRRAVWGKQPGHGIDEPGFLRPARSMSMIGG
jgi:cyclic pyranopterin phosphate synthase